MKEGGARILVNITEQQKESDILQECLYSCSILTLLYNPDGVKFIKYSKAYKIGYIYFKYRPIYQYIKDFIIDIDIHRKIMI